MLPMNESRCLVNGLLRFLYVFRHRLAGVLLGLVCIAVAAPAHAEHPLHPKPLLVGFAQDHLANDWRLAQLRELEQALSVHPHIRFIYTDAKGSTARQIRDIEDMIQQGVDILITSPRDSVAMTPVIASAHQKGIAVVLLTRQIQTEDYTSFISPDDESIARDAARFLISSMQARGRILMLQGLPNASTTQQRTAAFMDEIADHPDLGIAAIRIGNYLRNDTIQVMEDVLAQGIAFDAIYAQSDSMASGARIVLKHAGVDLSRIHIVGIDYITEARSAILAGEQAASFTYPTSAREAAQVVFKIAEGKQPPRHIRVPSQRVDASNVHLVEPIF